GFSIDVPTQPACFEVLGFDRTLKNYFGDVRDLKSLTQAFEEFQPEIVFHMAAQSIVNTCIEEPKQAFETNLLGTVNLLEVLRRSQSVRAAVLVTSDKCYENVEWDYGYRETDRLGGRDPYSASKACAEIAFSSYARTYFGGKGMPRIATGRAGNVIGGGDWA